MNFGRKVLLGILLLFLLIPLTSAALYHVTDLDCQGLYKVKTRTKPNIDGDFAYTLCELNEDGYWYCDCKQSPDFNIATNGNVTSEFDIVIEYWIGPYNNTHNQRTLNINNFRITPPPEPPFPIVWVIVIIMIIIFIVVFLTYMIYRYYKRWLLESDI